MLSGPYSTLSIILQVLVDKVDRDLFGFFKKLGRIMSDKKSKKRSVLKKWTLLSRYYYRLIKRKWGDEIKSFVALLLFSLTFFVIVKNLIEFFATYRATELAEAALAPLIFLQILTILKADAEKIEEHKREKHFYHSIELIVRNLVESCWESRVLFSIMAFYFLVNWASKVSQESLVALKGEGLLPVMGVILAPLITWITLCVRKEIEISKLREKWGDDVKRLLANYTSSCRAYVSSLSLTKMRIKDYSSIAKAATDDASLKLEATDKTFNCLAEKQLIEKEIWETKDKLEVSLKNYSGAKERELLEIVRDIEEGIVAVSRGVLRSRYKSEGGSESLTNHYVEHWRGKVIRDAARLSLEANSYFSGEWKRIKGFDDEIKKTIVSISMIMLSVVVAYLIIVLSGDVSEITTGSAVPQ